MSDIQQLLMNHIDIWTVAGEPKKTGRGRSSGNATSVYGIKKLRELILELAMRGKLVLQDPNNIPAGELLKCIQAAKEKLIAEGRIKKGKPLPSISDDEKLFGLPKNWEWARIGNTGKIFNGNSINENEKLEKYTNINDGFPFIATKDVEYGGNELNYMNGVRIPFENNNFKVAHKGAVLICSEGGSAGKKIGMTNRDICFGNKLYANETWAGIAPRFVFYVYQAPCFYQAFSNRMTGIIGGVSINEFLMIPIPIPPESEQNRIVAKVDELMKLCDQLEAQQNNAADAHEKLVEHLLGTLTQAQNSDELSENWQRIVAHFDIIFTTESSIDGLKHTLLQLAVLGNLLPQDMNDEPASELLKRIQAEKFKLIEKGKIKKDKLLRPVNNEVKPFKLPTTWVWARLGELTVLGPSNGYSPKPSITPTDYRCLTLSATTKGFFKADCFKYVDIDRYTAEQFFLKQDDLLIQRANSIEYVGVSAIYDGKDDLFIYPDLMMRIRISSSVNLRYLHFCLLSENSRMYFKKNATGTQGNMPKINQGTVVNIAVPLPPAAEQQRIVAKVEELMQLCNQLKDSLAEANLLKQKLADAMVEQTVL